jgi:MYXO-CTERM domain-containing protein
MRSSSLIAAASSVAALALIVSSAHAEDSLAACGDIHVEAQAECTVVPPTAACETMCTPLTVEAACAAELTAQCEGKCNAELSAQCQAECGGTCMAQCEVDPGKFDCRAQCVADCGGECEAHCAAGEGGAHCRASCEGSCSASCDADCDIEVPEVDCAARCEASCHGSCEAQANFDCQVDCQADFYADCEVRTSGGCKTDCETMKGALFCDGQYVDHDDNLEECIAALEATLDIKVETYAEGSSDCANGMCTAEGEAGVKCSAAPYAPASAGGLAVFGLLGAVLLRRRRR